MKLGVPLCVILVIFLTAGIPASAADAPAAMTPEAEKFFEAKIRPVLVDACMKCHGADPQKVKGELLLDSREGLLRGGASKKPAVVPGEPDKSLLIHAVRYHDADLKMPPKAKLSAEQIADLEAWVKMGAPDPRVGGAGAKLLVGPAPDSPEAKQFWSFQPVGEPPVPAVKNAAWPKNPVDSFILAKLEEKGLAPVAPADKLALIRRATFDLTGLPPTPDEVDAFLADASGDAFEKVVDRLLASPHYGERWGRHWLDVVRYADTAGDSSDYPVPQAHLYRNWVIDAFNRDKPYDQFLREQVAGDLLPADGDAERNEKLIATGYLAISRRFSVRPESRMHLTIEDTIDVVSKSVLGLTVACARCHDHKYDPIPQKDYYALYGFFSSTRYPFAGSENDQYQKDFVPLAGQGGAGGDAADELTKKKADIEAQLKLLEQKRRTFETLSGEEKEKVREEGRRLRRELGEVVKAGAQVPTAYAVVDDDEPKDAFVQLRGEPDKRGDKVRRGFPQVLGGQTLGDDAKSSGRLELARWLTDPSNPLTARVMVNRIWQYHFGDGLVRTPSDFGARGRRPTHPQLLDYLARRFVESGWSIKRMHRLIMLSGTYQLSSKLDEASATADAENELWGRFNRRRLDAEIVRDAMLAASGELDRAVAPGPHPFPPMQKWRFTQHNAFEAVYPSRHRSVYLMTQRIRKHPFLEVFDGADPNISTARRLASTTPIQALLLMNDPFVHEQSEKLATRLINSTGDDAGRVELAYRLALGRKPGADELTAATTYLASARVDLQQSGTPSDQIERAALASVARVLFASNEFVYID
jgi:hypothetical protein